MKRILSGLLGITLAFGAFSGLGIAADAAENDSRTEVMISSTETSEYGTFTTTGSWGTSGLPAASNTDYTVGEVTTGSKNTNQSGATATWTLNPNVLYGLYDVYFYKISRYDTDAAKSISVMCGDKNIYAESSFNMYVPQSSGKNFKGEWVKLGDTYDFSGEKVSVTLCNNSTYYAQAKAVKFVPAEVAPIIQFANTTASSGYTPTSADIKMPDSASNPGNYTNIYTDTGNWKNGVTNTPAVFDPVLPIAGTYDVYIWQTRYDTEWPIPLINVKLSQGETVYEKNGVEYLNDQTTNNNLDWVKIGTYSFDQAGTVDINVWGDLNNPEGQGRLRVSYIKLVRTGGVSETSSASIVEKSIVKQDSGITDGSKAVGFIAQIDAVSNAPVKKIGVTVGEESRGMKEIGTTIIGTAYVGIIVNGIDTTENIVLNIE